MMSGEVSRARSMARSRVVRLGDDLEVGLVAEDVGDPHPEQGVVVDDEDPRDLVEGTPVGTAASALWPAVVRRCSSALLSSRGRSGRDRQTDDGTAVRPRSYVESGTDQLGTLAHELQSEVAPASRGHRRRGRTLARRRGPRAPSCAVELGGHDDVVGGGVLADILQCLLGHAQDDGLLAVAEQAGRRGQIARDDQAGERPGSGRSCPSIAPSRPSWSSSGGRSWLMNARTSPSSRRSSSRR